jgi:hypothetical protein
MAARTTPITMPTRIPNVINDAKTRRATRNLLDPNMPSIAAAGIVGDHAGL